MIFLLTYLILLLRICSMPQASFEAQVLDDKVSIGYGLAVGDVDGDGKPDILLADKKQFAWYRNGDWKRFVLAENLTEHDNVCIAARDLDGDAKVEVAVGAQWNPSETTNGEQSGSVHYLLRPADPTQLWKAVELPHEPTVHRMKWFKSAAGKYYLLVVPLHGRGNASGEGRGVNIIAYKYPGNPNDKWPMYTMDSSMHLTHNFQIDETGNGSTSGFYLAGKEGIVFVHEAFGHDGPKATDKITGPQFGAGEVRLGKAAGSPGLVVTIEPMHGDKLVIYEQLGKGERTVVDDNLKEGHALAVADLSGEGTDQIVAGWRIANKDGLTGIKLYSRRGGEGTGWEAQWIDQNGIACEDLMVADLNADGKPEIIASGRASHNLKVYWNRSK